MWQLTVTGPGEDWKLCDQRYAGLDLLLPQARFLNAPPHRQTPHSHNSPMTVTVSPFRALWVGARFSRLCMCLLEFLALIGLDLGLCQAPGLAGAEKEEEAMCIQTGTIKDNCLKN